MIFFSHQLAAMTIPMACADRVSAMGLQSGSVPNTAAGFIYNADRLVQTHYSSLIQWTPTNPTIGGLKGLIRIASLYGTVNP